MKVDELQRALCELSLKELTKHKTEMAQREEAVSRREVAVAQREREVAQREAAAEKCEQAVSEERRDSGEKATGAASAVNAEKVACGSPSLETERVLASTPTPARSLTSCQHFGDSSRGEASCSNAAIEARAPISRVQGLQTLPLTTQTQPPVTPQMAHRRANTPGTGSARELKAMFEQRAAEQSAGREQAPPRVPSVRRFSAGSGASGSMTFREATEQPSGVPSLRRFSSGSSASGSETTREARRTVPDLQQYQSRNGVEATVADIPVTVADLPATPLKRVPSQSPAPKVSLRELLRQDGVTMSVESSVSQ